METGRIINQYKIISAIGKGGMGEVFLAQDTKLDRKVALKILPSEFADDKDRMSRFVREAKSASALNHPNIITIYEIGESDGTHFIATEFIEGETLSKYLKGENVSLKSVLEIATQIASALQTAHSAGIVHRDIKPDNVMVRQDGLAKILDFGVAKLARRGDTETKGHGEDDNTLIAASPLPRVTESTTPGMIIGTASYMSPEQAKGKEIDARSDIFSFGIVFYEMLTGNRAFEGETALESISSILKDEPKPISQFLPEVPSEIERIVNKTLRKDREERYQTAKDLVIDLKDAKQSLELQNLMERSIVPNKDENKTQILKATTLDDINHTTTNQSVASNPKTKYFASGLLTLLLAVGGFFGYKYLSPTKQIESIAVMPFVNESKSEDVEYLSDGMSETLINSLSQIPNLSVKARSSVFRYKGKEQDLKKIAAELNVQAILTGRVVQRGDQITLSLELLDAKTETHIWGNSYQRKSSDLVTLQTDIARDVSSRIKSQLSNAEVAKIEKNSQVNAEAYELYLKGLFQYNRLTGNSLKQAVEYFKQSIEKDPNYAPAYVGLGKTLWSFSLWSLADPKDCYPQMKAAALKTLELDDSLPGGHEILGGYLRDFERDWAGAEKEFRRAIELDTNNIYAYESLGWLLAFQKRFDEAIAAGKRGTDLDPRSTRSPVIQILIYARRYDEAIAELNVVRSLDPNYADTYWRYGTAYYGKGSYQEAIASFQKYLELDDDPVTRAYLALAKARTGDRDEAVKQLNWLKQESSRRYIAAIAFAITYLALGEKDEVYKWLEKDVEDRSGWVLWYSVTPALDELRNEQRFKAILKRVNLPE